MIGTDLPPQRRRSSRGKLLAGGVVAEAVGTRPFKSCTRCV